MICEVITGLLPLADSHEVVCLEQGRVAIIANYFVAAAFAVVVFWIGWRLGRMWLIGDAVAPSVRAALAGLSSIVALLLLAAAIGRPHLVLAQPKPGGFLSVLIDVSDSVRRDKVRYSEALERVAGIVEEAGRQLGAQADLWAGAVTVFAENAARHADNLSLSSLAKAVGSARPHQLATDATNGAAGLDAAMAAIEDSRQAGVVLLLSDGNWLSGDAEPRVRAAAARGIPLHVVPTASGTAGAGLVSANLPPTVHAGADVFARLVIAPRSEGSTELRWRRDLDVDTDNTKIIPAGRARPVRVIDRFERRGIRYLDFVVAVDGESTQRRRMFTLVKAPPRLLTFGPARWLDALPADRFTVVRADPADPPDPGDFDAVVIDSVRAEAFAKPYAERLARAVVAEGKGIFLVNGPHNGPLSQSPTLESWEGTPMEPLLPVSTDPRTVIDEPPPRNVAIIIDTSGSMAGWPLQMAKAIGRRIIESLRPIDTLRILTFATGFDEVLRPTPMNNSGVARALNALRPLSASGGTQPGPVLSQVEGNYCGLFFLSDGEFSDVPKQTGCFTTVFELTGSTRVVNANLKRLGEVIAVGRNGIPRSIRLKFLEPEERKERFRPGSFVPAGVVKDPVLAPALPIDGVVIAYPRPEALVISVHPDAPPDPVVAYRDENNGSVGVFLSTVPAAWTAKASGVEALSAYVDRLVGWSDIDRYLIAINEVAGGLSLTVTVLDPSRVSIMVDRLVASIVYADGRTDPIQLDAVAGETGQFRGHLALPRKTGASDHASGLLRITEPGAERSRPEQRIPIVLPVANPSGPAGGGTEIWSYGLNEAWLRHLANSTGGAYLEAEKFRLDRPIVALQKTPLHGWLLAVAAIFFATGIIAGGARL